MFKFILSLSFTLFTSAALAIPVAPIEMNAQKLMSIRPSGNLRAANFRAIVALSNCSGSLVRFAHSTAEDKAMVLTNGHCVGAHRGFLKPGQVVVNKPISRSFGLLNNDGSKVATLSAEKIIFATMTKTDMALYGLTKTYGEILKTYGVQALTLAPQRSVEKTNIAVVSGYWKKIYSCQVDKFIYALKEADWLMRDSVKYSQPGCETIGGTSGSPIINTATYEVVGVNNTGNENGGKCTMNNPCEIDEQGKVVVEKGAAYGQQTYVVYSCLNQNKEVDLNMPNCMLRPN
ncbi:MAG: trypsin-like peptidase domain-containing protein [Oligoflexia bacterium]|nr:trypsin-like peptidase domain-containing protein [Oligoflexia bacterium]